MHYRSRANQEKNTAKAGEFEILQKQIVFQGELIKGFQDDALLKDDRIGKLEREKEEIRFLQGKHERKLSGIQRLLTKEVGLKKYAERHICLNVDCKIRKPALGEFHTADPDIMISDNDI